MDSALIKEFQKEYSHKNIDIKNRLDDFKKVWTRDDKRIFSELCFCICTPQSKAISCDRSIKTLIKNKALFKGSLDDIRQGLYNVRFPNNKSKYILEAREMFSDRGKIKVKEKINIRDIKGTRNWFVKNVKGLGYKEASHFLRNIGFGQELAILDVHILRKMTQLKLIKEPPKTITPKKYLELETKLHNFAKKINIPMDELDLLFWSSATGRIFK
jgi:N-glycosylase/DNA lyase